MSPPEEISITIANCSISEGLEERVGRSLESSTGLPCKANIFRPSLHKDSLNRDERRAGDYWPKELTRKRLTEILPDDSFGLLLASLPVLELMEGRIPGDIRTLSLGRDMYHQFDVLPVGIETIFKQKGIDFDEVKLREDWRLIKIQILEWMNKKLYNLQKRTMDQTVKEVVSAERRRVRALFASLRA